MEQKHEVRTAQLQEFRKRIDKGLFEIDSGQGCDGELFIHGLIEDLDKRKTKRKA